MLSQGGSEDLGIIDLLSPQQISLLSHGFATLLGPVGEEDREAMGELESAPALSQNTRAQSPIENTRPQWG